MLIDYLFLLANVDPQSTIPKSDLNLLFLGSLLTLIGSFLAMFIQYWLEKRKDKENIRDIMLKSLFVIRYELMIALPKLDKLLKFIQTDNIDDELPINYGTVNFDTYAWTTYSYNIVLLLSNKKKLFNTFYLYNYLNTFNNSSYANIKTAKNALDICADTIKCIDKLIEEYN